MGRDNAAARSRELGAELKKRRQAAGLTERELGHRIGWHNSTVSRIEMGRARISLVDLMHYLGGCQVYQAEARDLMALCEDAERRLGYWLSPHGDWVDSNLGSLLYHESTASAVTCYDPIVVNGLLQTADYARALISRETWWDAGDIEHWVEVRLARQRILNRPRPARFTFYVQEQALRLQVGSGAITHEQLLQLMFLTALPHVTLRVVPAAAGHRGAFGSAFHLFSYKKHRPLVFLADRCCGVFLDDKEYVAPYRRMVPFIAEVALDEGQSREFVADLANEHDRERPKRDSAIYELEEEQP